MKRIISFVMIVVLLTLFVPVYAVNSLGSYKYIMPLEFLNIEKIKNFDIYKATHKNGSVSLYDADGNKLSDDYEYIGEFDDFNALARKNSKTYVLGYQGRVSNVYEGNVIGISDETVFIDLGENNDGRPLSYYQGEFGVYHGKNLVSTQPYSKFLQKNKYDCMKFFGGHMLYFENYKVGTVNNDFEVVIPAIYDDVYLPMEGWLIIARYEGKYGFLDHNGERIGEFEYDYIKPLYDEHNTFYVTTKDGLYGLVDVHGNIIFNPTLQYAPHKVYVDNRLIVVTAENTRQDKDEYGNLYGVIDFDGNIVLPLEHIDISDISEGRIAAKKSYDHGGYYNLYGEEVSEFNYRMISSYNEGVAFATRVNSDGTWVNHVIDYNGNVLFETGDWSHGYRNGIAYTLDKKLIDKAGNIMVDFSDAKIRIDSAYWWENANLWGVTAKDDFVVTDGTNYGVIRYTRPEIKAEPLYDYEYIDYGNVKRVDVYTEGYVFELYDGKTKYLDLYGNEITEEQMWKTDVQDEIREQLLKKYGEDNAFRFGDELYKVKIDEKWCIIDKDETVLKKYESGDPYLLDGTDDYILIIDGIKSTVTDKSRNILLELDEYVTFITESGGVISYNEDNVYKLTNIDGKTIVEDARHIEYIGSNVFSVTDEIGTRLVNSNGKTLISNFNYATKVGDNGFIGISTYNFEGYINTDGEYMLSLPKGYYVQGAFSEGMASVVQNIIYSRYGETSYINEKGEIVLKQQEENGHMWTRGGEFKNGIAYIGRGLGKAGCITGNVVRCTFDTPSDWAKDDVNAASELGLIPEHLKCRYRKNITRESFCELIYQLPFVSNMEVAGGENVTYKDTQNEKISFLSKLGIINGVGDNRFAPYEYLTREQAATILYRVYSLYSDNLILNTELFADDIYISDWARNAIYTMKEYGIMNGTGDNNFSPKESYTTEQSILTIIRLYSIIK